MLATVFQPAQGIGIDDLHLRRLQRALIERHQRRRRREEIGHPRIEIDQLHLLDLRILEDLAHGQPIPATEHQHPPRRRQTGQTRMHQRLVVAVFIVRRKLQVAVQEQAQIVTPARDDDTLVGRALGVNDIVGVDVALGQRRQLPGPGKTSHQHDEGRPALQQQAAPRRQLVPEKMQRPQRNRDIEQAEQQAGTNQPDVRRENQREQHRYRQRPEIVEGQHLRHQILEGQLALEDAHDQRNLQPDQHADAENRQIEHQLERPRQPGEHHEQPDRRKTAQQADHQLDLDEAADQVAGDVFRQPRTDAHGEKISTDHRRELHHRVAQQIGRQGAGDQFVGQPARGDDKDGEEKRVPHGQRCYPKGGNSAS